MKYSTIKLLLALSLGICYFYFGILKFFPGASPAEGLAMNTINQLTFGLIPASISIILLALWEVVVGVLFLIRKYMKIAVILGLVHMVLTFTPLYFFPDQCFTGPFTPTLLTQYILKNFVFIVGMLALYPSRR